MKKHDTKPLIYSFFILFLWVGLLKTFAQADSDPRATASFTFDEAVNEGVHNNLDLIAAQYNIPLAEADELTAGTVSNPSILFDTVFQPFGANWNQTNAGGPKQYDAIISYPFDLSGKIGAAKKSARVALTIAQAQFQDAIRLKVLDIRLAYIDVITQERQLALVKEKEDSLTRLVHIIENRIGKRSMLPLLQVRAQLARDQARLDTKQRESNLRAARVQLLNQLGRSASQGWIQTTTELRKFDLTQSVGRDELIRIAQTTRPDLEALRMNVLKSEFDEKLAHAQVWDNFNGTFGISRQGPIDPNPNDPNSNALNTAYSFNAGITIPLPIFNRQQGNINKAVLAGEQANKQIASKTHAIEQEIEGLIDQITLLNTIIGEYESKQLAAARQVRDSQQKLFGTGSNSLLDYFDSISAYQGTLSAYYDSVADYRRNLAKLNASVGRDVFK